MTQRIDPVGPRRDLAPVDQVRILTPVERELSNARRERERQRRKRPAKPPEGGSAPGNLDVRA